MKKNIHPNYYLISAKCSCGNNMQIYSTINNNLNLDVCNKCHPFFTGKQRTILKGGRIDQFNKRFNILKNKK